MFHCIGLFLYLVSSMENTSVIIAAIFIIITTSSITTFAQADNQEYFPDTANQIIEPQFIVQGTSGYSAETLPSYYHNDTLHAKNNLFGSAGSVIIFGGISANYERMVLNIPEFNSSLWLRLSAGKTYSLVLGGFIYQYLSLTSLIGKENNHFETVIGLFRFGWDLFNAEGYGLAGGIGYRYQKPEGGFLFRSGLAFPESLYLSVGYSF